jgi:uncharacterized Zn finger protein
MEVLCDAQRGVFPGAKQLSMSCSCPDSAALCKHLAAVLYGIGSRLDREPELLFVLRGVDKLELVDAAGAGAVLGKKAAGADELEADALADVFGIELDTAAQPAPKRKKKREAVKGRQRKRLER